VVFQILDELDRGHGLEGNMRLRDSETGAMVDVQVDSRTLGQYRAKFELRREALESYCASRRQVYVLAPTRANYVELACTALRAKAVVR
jgi:hypothetical protein